MPIVAWPTANDFPQLPLIEGYTETPPDIVQRTPMSTGPDKLRPRTTAGWRHILCSYWLTQEQREVLEAFYVHDTYGGGYAFDWIFPRTEAMVEAEFHAKPFYSPITPYGGPSGMCYQSTVSVKIKESITLGPGGSTWPTANDFPQSPELGATVTASGTTVMSELNARQRSTFTPGQFAFGLAVTGAQLQTFDDFYCTNSVHYWGWQPDPLTGFGIDARDCRFVGLPQYTRTGGVYRIGMIIEMVDLASA